jgi:hypothetical protein
MTEVVVTPGEPVVNVDSSAQQKPETAPETQKNSKEPDWLPARLEQARRSILKDLGVDDVEAAKAAITAAKAADEQKKSEAQKAAEFATLNKTLQASLDATTQALGTYAKAQMAGLSDAQRAAVAAVAGDDAAKQLSTIDALRPTWASAAAPAATATPSAPVTDTAPNRGMPKDGGGHSPPDHSAVWAELQKTNPVLAARYALENGVFTK